AQRGSAGPTIIICKTTIGKGAPNLQGSDKVHGAPLGAAEIAATREAIGWTLPPFEISEDVYAGWNQRERGDQIQRDWKKQFALYSIDYPQEAQEFTRRMSGQLPDDFAEKFAAFLQQTVSKAETVASRKASQFAITALVD